MKIANFRKSSLSYDETLKNVKDVLKENKWELKGESNIDNGIIFHIYNEEVFNGLMGFHKEFIGFIPSTLLVIKEEKDTYVGTLDTGILRDMTSHHNHGEEKYVKQLTDDLKNIIQNIAKVEDMKIKNVRVFSTEQCPYCKMEKEWLDKNKIKNEVVYVDKDQKMAQYMVERTGQMGVPATEIEYEDGEMEYIIGFDKNRLSDILGVKENKLIIE